MKSVKRNEIEAMDIIINIQCMQDCIYGKRFTYYQFNGNSVEELRKLQDSLIIEYNKTFNENRVTDSNIKYFHQ
jgi:hypothetical protein